MLRMRKSGNLEREGREVLGEVRVDIGKVDVVVGDAQNLAANDLQLFSYLLLAL